MLSYDSIITQQHAWRRSTGRLPQAEPHNPDQPFDTRGCARYLCVLYYGSLLSVYLKVNIMTGAETTSAADVRDTDTAEEDLLLPGLEVQRFRGIESLRIPSLPRVTLLVGANGAGKTSLLDAVRAYAAGGDARILGDLLRERDELLPARLEYDLSTRKHQHKLALNWRALFNGRDTPNHFVISTGEPGSELSVKIGDTEDDFDSEDNIYPPLDVTRGDSWGVPRGTPCVYLKHGTADNYTLWKLWSSAVFTANEGLALSALRQVTGSDDIESVAVLYDKHLPMVKINGQKRPVSLRSLGNGAESVATTVFGLCSCSDGILLLDEASVGLHYSKQSAYWETVFSAACDNNVQVIATTQSFACVAGFAEAATRCDRSKGLLARMSWQYGYLQLVQYPEEEALIAAQHGIEVR